MPSTQEFRRRIKSVNNTKQITKAMEMIASIKMQKAVKTANSARSYIQNAWNMLEKMAGFVLPVDHPLISERETKAGKIAVILVTSDRGLCGSYNSEVIKKFTQFTHDSSSIFHDSCDIIAIGKRSAEYVKRYKVGNLVAEFPSIENVTPESIAPIAKMTIDEYLAGKYDRVVVIYSHFESSLKQTPVSRQILPIVDEHIDRPELWEQKEDSTSEFKFEPDANIILDNILKQVLQTQIFGAVIEANASEQSARMVAMKNATDNAGSLIDDLQLVYNTVRQGNITREIAEISGAAEAMK
jgi:F-type H+-transporting ATPase subunit gamma